MHGTRAVMDPSVLGMDPSCSETKPGHLNPPERLHALELIGIGRPPWRPDARNVSLNEKLDDVEALTRSRMEDDDGGQLGQSTLSIAIESA